MLHPCGFPSPQRSARPPRIQRVRELRDTFRPLKSIPEDQSLMRKLSSIALLALALALFFAGCKGKEKESNEPELFAFVVYPGSRYLPTLTETTKKAHKVVTPNADPPPVAIYDTDAP